MIRQPESPGAGPKRDAGARWAVGLLALVLVFAPLPFGSVLLRDRTLLAVAAWVALALVVAGRRQVEWPSARAVLPLVAVAVYGFLQALSWPSGLVSLLGGRLEELWAGARALGGEASAWVPLSLAPRESVAAGLSWLAVAATLVTASAVGGDRRHRRILGAALLGVGLVAVAYGADNFFRQAETLWGVKVPGDPSRLRGTFVNPDHFALYLGMPITLSVAWGWWALRRLTGSESLERRLLGLALPLLAGLAFFVALAFTGSRAGLLAVGLAVVAQAAFLVLHYRRWQAGLVGIGALLVGAGGVLAFGLRQGLGRWMETSAYEIAWNARLVVYRRSLEVWGDFPLLGTGLGTFEHAFGLVQGSDLRLRWQHAHSDVLELLVTAGVVALPLVVLALVRVCRRLWTVFSEGRRSEDRAAGLAALGALVGATTHSLVDFGLSIPANAFTLAVVVGLASGAATLTDEEKEARRLRGEQRRERRRRRRAAQSEGAPLSTRKPPGTG